MPEKRGSKYYYGSFVSSHLSDMDKRMNNFFASEGMIVEDSNLAVKFLADKIDKFCDWLSVNYMTVSAFSIGFALGVITAISGGR